MRDPLDLDGAFQDLLERSRRNLGECPTDADLLAYHRGQLEDEKVALIRDRMACDPAVTARYLELVAEPERAVPKRTEDLSRDEHAAAWQAITARISATGQKTEGARKSDPVLRIWALAASVAFLCVSGWSWMLHNRVAELENPRPHVAAFVLKPDAPRMGRGDRPAARIRPDENGMHLTMTLFGIEKRDVYRLDIRDLALPEARLIWSQELRSAADDRITVDLPRAFLPAGEYELVLAGARDEPIATYHVIVEP